MSAAVPARHEIGANNPPVVPPKPEDLTEDLKSRFPELDAKVAEFEKALATYPDEIDDADTAKALQDLLGQMKAQRVEWENRYKEEKRPWDRLGKIVINFFSAGTDKIEKWEKTWRPRHLAYLDKKAAESRRAAEAEAVRQRAEADRLRAEATAAEARRVAAETAEREARQREEEARQRAAAEESRRREAEAAAAAAREEEARIARERAEREAVERSKNTQSLADIAKLMRQAESLHFRAESGTAGADGAALLDELIRPGGSIGRLAGPVAESALLDDTQRSAVGDVRDRLGVLRAAFSARLEAAAAKAADEERKRLEAEEAAQAAAREARRKEAEAAEAEAIARRKTAEAAAEAATEAAKVATKAAAKETKAAETTVKKAQADQKAAAREQQSAETDAERTANRADRMDRKLETSTDADHSRTRGELGTVGSITGRWKHDIVDPDALRAVSGPLGPYLTDDAMSGAAHRWMQAHREGFSGERVEDALAGVVFFWDRDVAIR